MISRAESVHESSSILQTGTREPGLDEGVSTCDTSSEWRCSSAPARTTAASLHLLPAPSVVIHDPYGAVQSRSSTAAVLATSRPRQQVHQTGLLEGERHGNEQ
jgi:hypothetical protein